MLGAQGTSEEGETSVEATQHPPAASRRFDRRPSPPDPAGRSKSQSIIGWLEIRRAWNGAAEWRHGKDAVCVCAGDEFERRRTMRARRWNALANASTESRAS